MLFLNNLCKVEINVDESSTYSLERKEVSETLVLLETHTNEDTSKWLLALPLDKEEKSSIAFKFDGEKVIEADKSEAVVHSFMPTRDYLSIPFKINGDFSTDPSRTKVINDGETNDAIEQCVNILYGLIKQILISAEDKFGIIKVLGKASFDPLNQIKGKTVSDAVVQTLQHKVRQYYEENSLNGVNTIYLQPRGITDDDFETIIQYINVIGIGNRLQIGIPELVNFMKAMGMKELPVEKCLKAMSDLVCSESTRVTVLANLIKNSRFGIEADVKEDIINAYLYEFKSGIKKIKEVKSSETIDENFEGAVTQLLDSNIDYVYFAKKVGIKTEQLANSSKTIKEFVLEHKLPDKECTKNQVVYSKTNVIKKWRSVEKNVAAVLELTNDITSVIDVSNQNLGYDLEAILSDGTRKFYEVKSVESFGDMISITNNEYSTASHYKEAYYLAITCQNDASISICFVKNPINALSLSKRVTRWEWICNEYSGEIVERKMTD